MTPWTNIGQNSGVSPWNSLGQNTGVSSLSLLQEIFPTQGWNTGLPQCRQILYQLTYKGNPRILEWVAYPFSSQSSKPRNWTGVSCIAGRFFTNWALREGWNNTNYIFSWRCIWEVWNPKELIFRKWENNLKIQWLRGWIFCLRWYLKATSLGSMGNCIIKYSDKKWLQEDCWCLLYSLQ